MEHLKLSRNQIYYKIRKFSVFDIHTKFFVWKFLHVFQFLRDLGAKLAFIRNM